MLLVIIWILLSKDKYQINSVTSQADDEGDSGQIMGKRERKTELNDREKIIIEKHNNPPSFRFNLTSGNTVGATFLFKDGTGGTKFFGGSIYITNQRIIFEADSDLDSVTGSSKIISLKNIEINLREDGFNTIEKNGIETKFLLTDDLEIQEHLEVLIRNDAIDKAKQCEEHLDYKQAIELYDKIGKPEEAARVRKLKAEQSAVKVDQTVVHGDYVDDRDTIIKDSVVNKSNIGAGGNSKAEELREAKALLDDGIIDDDEFKQMKKEILGK